MKITKSQLKEIIKEEMKICSEFLGAQAGPDPRDAYEQLIDQLSAPIQMYDEQRASAEEALNGIKKVLDSQKVKSNIESSEDVY